MSLARLELFRVGALGRVPKHPRLGVGVQGAAERIHASACFLCERTKSPCTRSSCNHFGECLGRGSRCGCGGFSQCGMKMQLVLRHLLSCRLPLHLIAVLAFRRNIKGAGWSSAPSNKNLTPLSRERTDPGRK